MGSEFLINKLLGVVGIFVILGLAFAVSNNRKSINWRTVGAGIGLQVLLALVVFLVPGVSSGLSWIASRVVNLLDFSNAGSSFMFGSLADPSQSTGFIFAFKVLPVIVFFSALMSMLYYFGVLQAVVKVLAKVVKKTMGTSGAETLAATSNIFVGQTEAPLLIKPYLKNSTNSEITTIMTAGFSTIAGAVFAGLVGAGISPLYLITASVMSVPGAICISKIMVPEVEKSETADAGSLPDIQIQGNLLEAVSQGTTDGLRLAVNVGAMLIAFIALIAMADGIFRLFDYAIDNVILSSILPGRSVEWGWTETVGQYAGIIPGSLSEFFGYIFYPIAILMGVPFADASSVASLIGLKVAANEFVAFFSMGNYEISEYSTLIVTFALCGFANFSSIGIQIGGISGLVPSLRPKLGRFALRAMFGGVLTSMLTATIAGILYFGTAGY